MVGIGNRTSSTLILSTGSPQGCVLCPALFTLFIHDCSATYPTNVKFAADTTVDNDGTHYREKIQHLIGWCSDNNLVLNSSKTKEVIVEFRKSRRMEDTPLHIQGEEVEQVET